MKRSEDDPNCVSNACNVMWTLLVACTIPRKTHRPHNVPNVGPYAHLDRVVPVICYGNLIITTIKVIPVILATTGQVAAARFIVITRCILLRHNVDGD